MYDVIIVGAGPAGLFAAYELITRNKKLNILLLDKGRYANKRKCPMNEENIECCNCKPCAILTGYGGAGTFSDGKLNFIPKHGKSDLFKYLDEPDAYKIIDECEEIFKEFGMDSEVYPSNMDEALVWQEKCVKNGARLLLMKQKHLGTDRLPTYIQMMTDYIKKSGVHLKENTDVIDINIKKGKSYDVICKINGKKETITTDCVIVAPGRVGSKWIQELADKNNIKYQSKSIEIGVRVEVRKQIMEKICDIIYDPAIFLKTKTYNDEIRTFCTNPGGYVTKENYDTYICVNGHSFKDKKSNNTNFAFITKVSLTHPVTNTRKYGESIAQIANTLEMGSRFYNLYLI